MRTVTSVLWAAILLAVGGCANYTVPPITQEQPRTAADQNFEAVWDSTLAVLHKYYFVTDPVRGGVQDREYSLDSKSWTGRIQTLPMTGQQWFEFWRGDAATRTNLAESSLQTIYRTVTVTIRPVSPGSTQYTAVVEATEARSDLPQKNFNDAIQVYSMFVITGDYRAREKFLLNENNEQIPTVLLVPLGRNAALENKISAEIGARTGSSLATSTVETPAPARPTSSAENSQPMPSGK